MIETWKVTLNVVTLLKEKEAHHCVANSSLDCEE